jgi:hypothetical protein
MKNKKTLLMLINPFLAFTIFSFCLVSSCSTELNCDLENNSLSISEDQETLVKSFIYEDIKSQINRDHIQELEIKDIYIPPLDYDLIFNSGIEYDSFRDRAIVKDLTIMKNIKLKEENLFNVPELSKLSNIYIENFTDSRYYNFDSFQLILVTKNINLYLNMKKKEA